MDNRAKKVGNAIGYALSFVGAIIIVLAIGILGWKLLSWLWGL